MDMLKILKVGDDPRKYLEFTEIRNEINKLSHPAAEQVDFSNIESLAKTLFAKNGVDLQTATYLTFAKTRLNGLEGFMEGCEIIAKLITNHWQQLWPKDETVRINILDWLNIRVDQEVRDFPYTVNHIALLIQLEQPLKKIVDKLKNEQLKKTPKIFELLEYLKNTRMTLEKRLMEKQKVVKKEPSVSLPKKEETKIYTSPISIQPVATNSPQIHYVTKIIPAPQQKTSRFKGWHGLIIGSLMTGILLLGINSYWQHAARPEKVELALFTPLSKPSVSLLSKSYELQIQFKQINPEIFQQQLQQLYTLSPLATRYYGDNLVYITQNLWPENKISQDMAQDWQKWLDIQRQDRFMRDGYYKAKRQLQKLEDTLTKAEEQNQTLTISQVRSAIYDIKTQLDREVPLEELLRQLSVTKNASPILIKNIDDRFNTLLSHYHELRKEK